jgi:hypothetical protein
MSIKEADDCYDIQNEGGDEGTGGKT